MISSPDEELQFFLFAESHLVYFFVLLVITLHTEHVLLQREEMLYLLICNFITIDGSVVTEQHHSMHYIQI